jgi:hypothetical protein
MSDFEDIRVWHDLSPGGFMIIPPQKVTVKITALEGGGCRIEALDDGSDEGSG